MGSKMNVNTFTLSLVLLKLFFGVRRPFFLSFLEFYREEVYVYLVKEPRFLYLWVFEEGKQQ